MAPFNTTIHTPPAMLQNDGQAESGKRRAALRWQDRLMQS